MTGWQPQQYDPRQQTPTTPPQWQQSEPPLYRSPLGYAGQQAPQQQRPRRPIGAIAAVAGVVVLAAVAGAIYLTRGHTATPPKALTCAQQYANWKNGPAYSDEQQLKADLNAVTATGKSEDIPAMDDSLKDLGAGAGALEAYPMPHCADPADYWAQALADMKASGDNAGTASGLGGIILAEAPLKNVPALETKLDAELAKNAGIKAG